MKVFREIRPAVSVLQAKSGNAMLMTRVLLPVLASNHFPTGALTRNGGLETAVSLFPTPNNNPTPH
jgi:hypothetical protein